MKKFESKILTENRKGAEIVFWSYSSKNYNNFENSQTRAEISNNFVFLKRINLNSNILKEVVITDLSYRSEKIELWQEIWIKQPTLFNFNYSYQDSKEFDFLNQKKDSIKSKFKTKFGFDFPSEQIITCTSFLSNNGKRLGWGVQDIFLHDFKSDEISQKFPHLANFCKRERKRKAGLLKTGEGYELCLGCNPNNHAEAIALDKIKKTGSSLELIGSTAYLTGHWWSCQSCSKKMLQGGVKSLVMDKKWVENWLEL